VEPAALVEGEEVFRALADAGRRRLLDALYERDGQTLLELRALLPEMTRHGVMKHLGVLEKAGLITTRRAGRHKLHYLNPVPIRLIHDRWISKFAQPLVEQLAALKRFVEEQAMERPRHVFEVFVRATPEQVWAAYTDPDQTRQWLHGLAPETDWQPGSRVAYRLPDGRVATEGVLVEVDPPRKLVARIRKVYTPELAADPPYRMTLEIEPVGAVGTGTTAPACKVTITCDEFESENANFRLIKGGQRAQLDTLKTFLETGTPLVLLGGNAA